MICWSPVSAAEQRFEHNWGVTTLQERPERIVSLSYNGADFFLALGVEPVAIRYWYGGNEHGLWPWAEDKLSAFKPVVIRGPINAELIAALEPDLIEAIWTDLSEDEYRLLSKIAPVVPPKPGYGPYETSWTEMLTAIGKITGKEQRAQEIIDQLQARIQYIRDLRPGWRGKTAFIGQPSGPLFFNASDVRWRIMQALGFEMPARLKSLSSRGFYTRLSREITEPYDADIVVWLNEASIETQLENLPLRHMTRAYKEGREIIVPPLLSGALAYSSPLSLDYALDELVALIDVAIDGDPDTTVSNDPSSFMQR